MSTDKKGRHESDFANISPSGRGRHEVSINPLVSVKVEGFDINPRIVSNPEDNMSAGAQFLEESSLVFQEFAMREKTGYQSVETEVDHSLDYSMVEIDPVAADVDESFEFVTCGDCGCHE